MIYLHLCESVRSVQGTGLTADNSSLQCCGNPLNRNCTFPSFSPQPRSHSSFQMRWGTDGRGLSCRPMARKGVLSAGQWEREWVRDRRLTAPWRQRGTQQHGRVKNIPIYTHPPYSPPPLHHHHHSPPPTDTHTPLNTQHRLGWVTLLTSWRRHTHFLWLIRFWCNAIEKQMLITILASCNSKGSIMYNFSRNVSIWRLGLKIFVSAV